MAILTINLKSNMYQFVIKFRSSESTELYPTLEGYDQSAWLNPLTFPALVFSGALYLFSTAALRLRVSAMSDACVVPGKGSILNFLN